MTDHPAALLPLLDTVASPVMIYQQPRLLYLNAAACDLLGCVNEEPPDLSALFHPDSAGFIADWQAAPRQVIGLPCRIFDKYGYERRIEISMKPVPAMADTWTITFSDLTEYYMLQEALEDSDRRFEDLVANLPAVVFRARVRPQGLTCDYVSPRIMHLAGISPDALIGDADLRLRILHPDDCESYVEAERQAVEQVVPFHWEGRALVRGHTRWLRYDAWPRRLGDGTLVFDGLVIDFTRQKTTEAALQESSQRFNELAANIPALVYSLRVTPDISLTLDYINPRCLEYTGCDAETLLNNPNLLFDSIVPEDAPGFWKAVNDAIVSNTPLIWEGRQLIHGRLCWRRMQMHPRLDANGDVVWDGIHVDLTDIKLAEQALAAERNMLRALIDHIPHNIYMKDTQGSFLLNNRISMRAMGVSSQDELVGKTDFDFFPAAHAQKWRAVELEIMRTGQPLLDWEFEDVYPDGRPKWVLMTKIPLRDECGQVIGLMGINRDITAYRQAQQTLFERTRLRDALEREKELSEMKTRVMTRIAHEFRTPLAVIGTSSHILATYYDRLDAEKKQRHFAQIKMQINRLSEMLNDINMTLQGVAQPQGADVSAFVAAPISLPRMCRDAIAQLRLTLDSDREIIVSADSGLLPIYADERLLRRAIINLLSNAIKYSPADSPIRLEIFAEDDEDTVTLRISDEGIGIPENEHSRIFEPLYRGSNIGEVPGLGLGLALVKDAVDQHQGSIEVSSAPGRGSVFTVHLPRQRSATG